MGPPTLTIFSPTALLGTSSVFGNEMTTPATADAALTVNGRITYLLTKVAGKSGFEI